MNKPESKHFILEVGVGGDPFPVMGARKILTEEVYLGLDNGSRYSNWREVASQRLKWVKQKDVSLSLASADATYLPIRTESIDEIVISNVFGDPQAFPRVPFMICEGKRVLKLGGLLTVIETITPIFCPIQEVESWVSPVGFETQQAYKGISPELLKYYPKAWIYSEEPFYITFKRL